METITLTDRTEDGLRVVRASTGPLALALMPALGGKISSLRDERSGREWLWRHPRLPYVPGATGAPYTSIADTGGWDECFPSVAPCPYPAPPWAGAPIQDHGELWSQGAALELREGPGTLTLACRWRGAALPYSFERALTLRAGSARLRCDYTVTSAADQPMPFIWCAHPLLAIEPGMRLSLPAGARFNRWAAHPPELTELSFDPLPGPAIAAALKVWSDPVAEGRAAVIAADGALAMTWDPALLPQVAVWANLGAWAADGGEPYYNLGLEPCIGAQDSLYDAVTTHGLYASLPPGGARTWWLEVELRP